MNLYQIQKIGIYFLDLVQSASPKKENKKHMSRYLKALCSLLLILHLSLDAAPLSKEEALWIGKRIFENECSQKKEKLVWWNQGEEFAFFFRTPVHFHVHEISVGPRSAGAIFYR